MPRVEVDDEGYIDNTERARINLVHGWFKRYRRHTHARVPTVFVDVATRKESCPASPAIKLYM
jgi:hypothetical protein